MTLPQDDGVTPCGFGATCRWGHARRVSVGTTPAERADFWTARKSRHQQQNQQPWKHLSNTDVGGGGGAIIIQNNGHGPRTPMGTAATTTTTTTTLCLPVVDAPAHRDPTLLRSQLEPWSTSALRDRLVQHFGSGTYPDWEGAPRSAIMDRLLQCYDDNYGDGGDGGCGSCPRDEEGLRTHLQPQHRRRRIRVRTPGADVRPDLLCAIHTELRAWRDRHGDVNTRPSIHASAYMILRKAEASAGRRLEDGSPVDDEGHDDDGGATCTDDDEQSNGEGDAIIGHDCDGVDNDDEPSVAEDEDDAQVVAEEPPTPSDNADIAAAPYSYRPVTDGTSRKARLAQKKLRQYSTLWTLATQALHEVDPEYASTFSALAVTYQFRGSPHIDKQNTGPFYGLAMGNFLPGTGGICVEVDAETVAVCDSYRRFAKVDGRFPHWVDGYDDGPAAGNATSAAPDGATTPTPTPVERYSLIYYSTRQDYQKPTVPYYGEIIDDDVDDVLVR